MLDRGFTVKFITSRNCFLAFSDIILRKLAYQKVVKLTHGKDERYFSAISHPLITDGKIVGIPTLYAKALGINEFETVFVSDVLRLPSLSKITISPLTSEDYEILESTSDTIQSSLLDQIRVVNKNQKVVIWVSKWLHTTVHIDDAEPLPYGYLANLTEVHITTPKFLKHLIKNDPVIIEKDEIKVINDINEQCPELNRLKHFYKNRKTVIFRVHPLTVPQNLTENDYIVSHPFNVFIFRRDMPNFINVESMKEVLLCNLERIEAPQDFRDSKEDQMKVRSNLVARLCIIDEHYKFLSDDTKSCFSEDASCERTIYISEKTMSFFNLSNGSKVSMGSSFPYQSDVSSVEVVVANKKTRNVAQKFKAYVAEHVKKSKCVLNSDICLEVENNVVCTLKFNLPSDFCVFDERILRTVRVYENSEKKLELHKLEPNSSIVDVNEICDEIQGFQKIVKQGKKVLSFKNCNENILIVGKVGSGKTTLAKLIAHGFNEKPNYVHIAITSCKKLKGKSIDSLHKIFMQDFHNMIYYQPSIYILDDLHVICGRSDAASEVPTQESLHFNRVSEMLAEMTETFQKSNRINVLATCTSTAKMNDHLLSSRGRHLFKNVYKIPELSKKEREALMEFSFLRKVDVEEEVDFEELACKTEGFVVQDMVDFINKSVFEMCKRNVDCNEAQNIVCTDDVSSALSSTVALALRDVQLHSPGDRDFRDVGGLHDVKATLVEAMRWPAQFPGLFSNAPLRLQTGMLLYGPPGVGKTLLVGAAAKQCGLRLISVKGPELLSKYIGASEQSVRAVFEKAQSARPCILFFDEFDSLAPRRGHDSTGVTDRVVNQLLTQLDGVETLTGVFVIAATSRPDLLDPALLRPGRLDKQIHCPPPNQDGVLSILEALSRSLRLADDVDLTKISAAAKGFTGADLQAILYTAQLAAVEETLIGRMELRPDQVVVSMQHLDEAVQSTRPSLSKEENAKYDKIYAKFQKKKNENDFTKVKQKATLA